MIIGGYHQFCIPSVCLYTTCKHLRGARVRITNTHTNNPSDARKRVPIIPAPGGMCEPWCAAYLVVRTLLLVLTVWLGLGGELAQTAKSPLRYASFPGGGRTYDQSLPPKVWGARIMPRSNTVEGNASMVGQDNSCRRSEHAQDLLHFKAMATSIPPGTQDAQHRILTFAILAFCDRTCREQRCRSNVTEMWFSDFLHQT